MYSGWSMGDYRCLVSSVIKPVGPEEPEVYWKRRALVGGIALVVLIVLFVLLRSCGGDPEPQPTAAPASPSASAQPTGAPIASPSASPSGSASSDKACADTDISVAVTSNEETYPSGVDPKLTMSITNEGTLSCERDVGSGANEISISSGGVRVWSSDDCSSAGDPDVVTLRAGEAASVTVDWPRTSSEPGCSTSGGAVDPGVYDAVGRNGKVESTETQFTLQ